MEFKLRTGGSLWFLAGLVSIASAQTPAEPKPPAAPDQEGVESATPPKDIIDIAAAVSAATDMLDFLESDAPREAKAGLLEDVIERVQAIQAQEPNHPFLPYLSGRALAMTGRRIEAVEEIRRFVETRNGRNEWRAFRLLGDLYVDQFPELARMNYRKAAALKENEPAVLFGLAVCASRLGRRREAIRYAREAIDASGAHEAPYLSFLAQRLLEDRKWEEAQRRATAALMLTKEEVRARAGERAQLMVLDVAYRLLIRILRDRIAEGGAGADAFLQLAGYMADRGAVGTSLQQLDVVAVLEAGVTEAGDSAPPRLLEAHAVALAQAGLRDDAIAAFERLIKTDPANTVAPVWLERIHAEHQALPATKTFPPD